MSSAAEVEQTRQTLLEQAQKNYDDKIAAAEEKLEEQIKQIKKVYDDKRAAAQAKYEEYISSVDEDASKRLKIVNKVIDAESEERRWKEEQAENARQAKLREEAERKLAEDAEKARQAEEERLRKIEEKKAAKARKKMLAERAKYPIPPGFVSCANSKKLAAKLKKLNGAGRYAFCCFYNAKSDKKFKAYCEELSGEYNSNVAWFDCCLKDMNFEDAMLLYEFNATPAVVICREGKPSNLHRYVIGDNDENRETLKRYAEKADND